MPRTQANPIRTAILQWFETVPAGDEINEAEQLRQQELLHNSPKRFTIYEPLVLLPTGSFTSSSWVTELDRHDAETSALLWSLILNELSKKSKSPITHLAVNEGIPLHEAEGKAENVLRSPSGLRMLHGDFGPSDIDGKPSQKDFQKALWASTKQNGIHQTWAPRWTMFSRGNVKEKARLLDFKAPSSKHSDGSLSLDCWAVDLYAGIGYFTFSYASLGIRVLCWEINPWSVEGLRRGAEANRWSIKVVQGNDLELPTRELVAGGERIVAFLEDNQKALGRIQELQELELAHRVVHVNCGFLPTSEPVWRQAWDMTNRSPESWLHLHENVGSDDKVSRRDVVRDIFEGWAEADGHHRQARVVHVESVKTFAPGVEHVVFDVHITRSSTQ